MIEIIFAQHHIHNGTFQSHYLWHASNWVPKGTEFCLSRKPWGTSSRKQSPYIHTYVYRPCSLLDRLHEQPCVPTWGHINNGGDEGWKDPDGTYLCENFQVRLIILTLWSLALRFDKFRRHHFFGFQSYTEEHSEECQTWCFWHSTKEGVVFLWGPTKKGQRTMSTMWHIARPTSSHHKSRSREIGRCIHG